MNKCAHCGMDKAIRNPSGYCDHLHWPEYCEVCRAMEPGGYKTSVEIPKYAAKPGSDFFDSPQREINVNFANRLDDMCNDIHFLKHPQHKRIELLEYSFSKIGHVRSGVSIHQICAKINEIIAELNRRG